MNKILEETINVDDKKNSNFLTIEWFHSVSSSTKIDDDDNVTSKYYKLFSYDKH